MPSFGDSAFIFILALILFGPKKLPELARQLGKLMAEFRRASNEFRMQMDEELRLADQAEQEKKIAALESAVPPVGEVIPEPEHPHMPSDTETTETPVIATKGELSIKPPATGLPAQFGADESAHEDNSTLTPMLDQIPHDPDPTTHPVAASDDIYHSSLPDRHTHTESDAENTISGAHQNG